MVQKEIRFPISPSLSLSFSSRYLRSPSERSTPHTRSRSPVLLLLLPSILKEMQEDHLQAKRFLSLSSVHRESSLAVGARQQRRK